MKKMGATTWKMRRQIHQKYDDSEEERCLDCFVSVPGRLGSCGPALSKPDQPSAPPLPSRAESPTGSSALPLLSRAESPTGSSASPLLTHAESPGPLRSAAGSPRTNAAPSALAVTRARFRLILARPLLRL